MSSPVALRLISFNDLLFNKLNIEKAKRVLSKTSTREEKYSMENIKIIESDITILKQQIDSLQMTVNSMLNERERKEKAIASLAKEKEQLSIDLKKQKRSNCNLKQQLDDERTFYYKEKEQYCNEMNNYKKLRQKLTNRKEANGDKYKKEIDELRNHLNQTLEANYNLSVKFLRMKNTKFGLKKQYNKLRDLHEHSIVNYEAKLSVIEKQLVDLINEQCHKPIPPSNKKYLQLIKQNAGLQHENLNLQFEIDKLCLQLERMKMVEMRHQTNTKLKFIHHSNNNNKKRSDKKCVTVKEEVDVKVVSSDDVIVEQEKSIKLELMTVSNSNMSSLQLNDSELSVNYEAYRTQSAPEVVQTVTNVT